MYESILVTGGAGFIGSSLALALKTRYPETVVIAFDNLRRRGSEQNLARLQTSGVRFVHGDVRCPADLEALTPVPVLIIECSAEPSAQAGYGQSPEYVIATNLQGCLNCLELCRRVKAGLLFLSSSRVYPYGPLNALPFEEDATRFRLSEGYAAQGVSAFGISEEFPLAGPRTIYGATKLAAELLIEEYADAYGLSAVINRCGLVTGPWQMGKSDQGVFAFWMAEHFLRRPLRYIGFGGLGKQVRDFIHVDDLTRLVLLQIQSFDQYAGQVFNVGGGQDFNLSLLECTELCRRITGNTIAVEPEPQTRRGDVKYFVTDNRRIRALSGWAPTRNARSTLEDIHQWLTAAAHVPFERTSG